MRKRRKDKRKRGEEKRKRMGEIVSDQTTNQAPKPLKKREKEKKSPVLEQ
jgi:hypothetical protein